MQANLPLDIQALVSHALHRQIRLSEFSEPVYIEDAQAVDDLVRLMVRTRDGRTEQVIVQAAELSVSLEQAVQESAANALASPQDFFLLIEAARIRLAYSFDPFFAVSLSGVQALPHQLQAVYERMLPQARLRFLLADDPGAGKTIMAGLLLKELKLRGVISYVLILTPAPLTIQWQDELYSKFDETFEVVNSDMVGNQLAGNVWERHRQCITSLDFAKQERVMQSLEQVPWDLIIIDEAHKCSARTQGEKVAKTRRYQLAERLSASAERILLLTATPHSGDPSQFAHFLRLLDADQFPDPRYDGLELDRSMLSDDREGGREQWFLRRIKEELRDREGNPLFTRRHVSTKPFELTWPEKRLYDHVTEYINRFLPYQQGGARRHSVALARTVLQRRLASSLHAIHRSLERRAGHFRTILQKLERLPASEHEKVLHEYRLLAVSGFEDEESEEGDLDEQQDEALVACFFRYYNWTHIWNEQVVRKAIAVGIKNRSFGYVANARKDAQENLILSGPAMSTVHFGVDVPVHELDLGEGVFLLSAAYAQQLLTPPAPPKIEIQTTSGIETEPGEQGLEVHGGETGGGAATNRSPQIAEPTPPLSKPVAPGRGGRFYRLSLMARPGDFFYVMQALERLNERAAFMETMVSVMATAKLDQPFVVNTLHNLVVEPMVEESDVVVLDELVEE